MSAEIGCSSQSLPKDGTGSTPGAVLLGILSTEQDGVGGWQRREATASSSPIALHPGETGLLLPGSLTE